MAECGACGAKLESLTGLTCPSCGSSLVKTPSQRGLRPLAEAGAELAGDEASQGGRMLRDSALGMLAKVATSEVPLGATHGYEIAHRYQLEPGVRPLSAVIHGERLLVLALSKQHVVVQSYALDGRFLGLVATYAQGEGEEAIGDPAGIALDDAGCIYLLDASGCRVHKLEPSGRALERFGAEGLGAGQLAYPRDLEVIGDGRMVLADTGNNRVQMWSAAGEHLRTIGPQIDEDVDTEVPSGSGPGEFDGPMGVTVDGEGRVYVADTNNHRVQVFDADGGFVRELGSEGTGSGLLLFPTDVRVAARGEVFVFDLHSRRVQKFDAAGTLLYGLILSDEGPHSVVGAVGDIDIGPDDSVYVPVPSESAVLRCRRVEG